MTQMQEQQQQKQKGWLERFTNFLNGDSYQMMSMESQA